MKRLVMHIVNLLLFIGIICAIGVAMSFIGCKMAESDSKAPQVMEVSSVQDP